MEPRTDQQSGRRRILVVDGDDQIQRLLDLSLRNAGFDVETVGTAVEALAAIAKRVPELIVSEVRLAGGADGFELCRQVKRRSDGANIRFIFLAEQTVETKVRGVEAGADDFLAKPVYVQEVVAHARALMQRRERDRLEGHARGDERFLAELDDFPLVDLLRALEANHKSGVVLLVAGGARGEIYFRDGVVVDAEVGRLSGLEAVCRLFSWTDARLEIEWKSIRRRDAISMGPGVLLMEALNRLDEWRRLLAESPPLSTVFEVDYHLLAERLAEIPDEVNATLRLFDGQRTFLQVIDDCGLSDLDALAVIGKLHREQIIRDVRSRPEVAVPGADIEGWLSEAAGPFRAAPARSRRELFAAAPEAVVGVHSRATARFEPLEESAREPAEEGRLGRFTDRLISEGGSGPSPLPAASTAPEPAPRARPPIEAPRVPVLAAETTQQGLGLPTPALSTRPGFAAVIPPSSPPRVAREVPTDVTPAVRGASDVLPAGADGVPEPLPPQSAEPAIVVPAPTSAPRIAAPPPPEPSEQRPVAGEILARTPTLKTVPSVGEGVKRVTDLGVGSGGAAVRDEDRPAQVPATGEVVAGPAKPEESRPRRKIILDPDIPEEDEDAGGTARWKKPLGVALGLALAVAVVAVALKKTGHQRRIEQAQAESVTKTDVAPTTGVDAAGAAGAAVANADAAAGATSASAGPAAHAAAAPRPAGKHVGPGAAPVPVMDERTADPKVARALPTEFPQLLAACRQAFTEKRAKDAEIACIAATDANPDSPDACALLGHALFNRKKRREALQWAERAVGLDPNHADAYVIIGGVKQAADDMPAAKAAYQKYLELAPNGQYAADLRAIVDSL
ncbi:MAG TPA: DUF4388 domain-containing protein [Polyangia bacterium]|jgi:CheY-like chemotaxis protein|nr:DUF4388 domain-containing protein [Polyangia bacterium]